MRCDIFCKVVDNFGDAAISWRLARQLAREHGAKVRLYIDDFATLSRIVPEAAIGSPIDDVEVQSFDRAANAQADVVIEAFGCGLPQAYVGAIATRSPPPLWIVLEYLSAEPWVARHHALTSPHPQLGIDRYFFFPGFLQGTGGVLRETGLLGRRDAFGSEQRAHLWRSLGHSVPSADALVVSLFAYESAPLLEWLDCWSSSAQRTVVAIPEGPLLTRALAHVGGAPAERACQRGALELRAVPFMPQSRYDELLWSCDVNFVRGEDSFVRAQWAARPLVWQIYPQQAEAHHVKLDAFVALYCRDLDSQAASAFACAEAAWNRTGARAVTAACAWEAFRTHHQRLARHAREWAERLVHVGELAANVAEFSRGKLK